MSTIWTSGLIGCCVEVVMGEPWNFEPIPLPSTIFATTEGGEIEVLLSCSSFKLGGSEFDALAGAHRYAGESLAVLARDGRLTCGFKAWRMAAALEHDAWKDWRKAPGPGAIGSIVLLRR